MSDFGRVSAQERTSPSRNAPIVSANSAVDGSAFHSFSSIYPSIAKIIGEGETEESSNETIQSLFYGSGVYVAEVGEFGIVLTNWHVVREARGCVLVRFSQFETPGAVIMADAIWDIAAIVVYRPPFVPFPISLEVPQIGDELWVAGFGQHSDLDGYQISSGPVIGYGQPDDRGEEDGKKTDAFAPKRKGPDVKAALPYETIQIGTGIRYGDSGGPILNRYGELAGILWGSDGHVAMGTFCLRLQAFLTQAQFQLMNERMTAADFFAQASRGEITVKKIAMPSVPAQNALRSSGIYPISSRPVYTAANEGKPVLNLPTFYKPAVETDIEEVAKNPPKEFRKIQEEYRAAHKTGYRLPPYPAVESPTLIAQRKAIGRNHPEVYANGRFAAASVSRSSNSARNQTTDIQPTAAMDRAAASSEKGDGASRNPSYFQNAGLASESVSPAGREAVGGTTTSKDDSAAMNVAEESVGTAAEDPDQNDEMTDGSPSEGKEKGTWMKKVPGFPNISLSHLQSIIAMVIVLFLFINSLRLLVITAERSGRSKE